MIPVIPETICTSYTSIHNGQIVHHIWLHLVTRAMIVGRCRFSCILNLLTKTNQKKTPKRPQKNKSSDWHLHGFKHIGCMLPAASGGEGALNGMPHLGMASRFGIGPIAKSGRYGTHLGEPPQNFEIHTTLHEKRSYQNTMPVSSYQICARFSLDESLNHTTDFWGSWTMVTCVFTQERNIQIPGM